jgi:ankyrin repeat protein
MLVRAHADPSRRDATGRSPLFAAAMAGRRPAVEKLLALGADPLGPDPKGQPLPVGLVDAGRVEMLPLLHAPRSVWSHRDPNGRTVLLRAVERHDLDTVRAALGAGADPNDGGATDATPLARACDSGKLDLVDVLLKGGADPNAADAKADPPLVRLARYAPGQFAELMDRLMAAGADIDRKGAHGMTALIAASTRSDPRPVRVLLRRGADPTLTDDEGKTAYTHAQRRNPQVTEDLMEATRAIATANPGERPTLETTRVPSDATSTTTSTRRSARVPTPRR